MKLRAFAVSLTLLLLACPAFAAGVDDAAVRIAVLPGEGERTPADSVVARVETALADMPHVDLLERAQISQVLREHAINLSGLVDRRDAVRVGQLLAVDAFVFIERLPGSKPAMCRIQVIETQTGIALAGELFAEQELADEPGPVLDAIRQGIAKQRTPLGDRHYLAIVGIRNEEPSEALDGLARTLRLLLAVDLQRIANVVLLDREQLQRLQDERALTGAEGAFKASAMLIDGGLRRQGGDGQVALTLLLTPLGEGEAQTLSLQFDPLRIDAFRDELLASLTARLDMDAPPTRPNAAAEGQRYFEQARLLTLSGDKEAALAAAEAAYAIWPNRTTRVNLAFAYSNLTLDGWQSASLISGGYHRDPRRFHEAGKQEQARSLRHEARMLELIAQQLRMDFASETMPDINSPESRALQAAMRIYPSFGVVVKRATVETAAHQRRVAILRRELLDLVMKNAELAAAANGLRYWEVLSVACANLRLSDLRSDDMPVVHELAAAMDELFTLGRYEGARIGWPFQSFNRDMQSSLRHLTRLREPGAEPARARFAEVFRRHEYDADPIVRAMALHGLVALDVDGPSAAMRLAQVLAVSEVTDAHHTDSRVSMALQAVNLLESKNNIEEAVTLCEMLMGPMLAEDGTIATDWLPLIRKWAQLAESLDGESAAHHVYDRALVALNNHLERHLRRYPNDGDWIRRQIRTVESWRGTPRETDADPHPWSADWPDDPWRHFEVRPLNLRLSGPASAVFAHGGRLYVMHLTGNPSTPRQLTVTVHRFPQGGPAIHKATITLGQGTQRWLSPAMLDGQLFIGTTTGIVRFDSHDKLTLLTEADGLPGTGVNAMAAYDGKLYLGMSDAGRTAFVEYDPVRRESRIIFSNLAVEPERRRDLNIAFIHADEARACLWVVGNRSGPWRYDPQTQAFEQTGDAHTWSILTPGSTPPIRIGDGLLYKDRSEMWFINLSTGRNTPLVGVHNRRLQPTFGFATLPHSTGFIPVWYDGDALFAYNSGGQQALYQFRLDSPPAALPSPDFSQGITFTMTATDVGPVIMDTRGEAHLIQRRADAPQRDPDAPQAAERAAEATRLFREGARIHQQEPDAAIANWQRIVTHTPGHPEAERALFYIGLTAAHNGDDPKAVEAYTEYLKRYPDSRWSQRIRERELPEAQRRLNESAP